MKFLSILSALTVSICLFAATIPETIFPVPAKRSMDPDVIAKAAPYLKHSPEKYESLVPQESPAPLTTEASNFGSSYNSAICPFCGKTGNWFIYDFIKDPDTLYCATTKKSVMKFPTTGKLTLTDYRGKKYTRNFFITPHLKNRGNPKLPVQVYPENFLARERIKSLLGTWSGGALMSLANAYYATGNEEYAKRAIAIMYGFAKALPGYQWTSHSRTVPLEKSELLEKSKVHDSGYHGWLGPARIAAGEFNFRNPMEAVYFSNFSKAWMMLADSKSWNGRKEFVYKNLFEEGKLHFYAYGAKQCVGNGIGMYAPGLSNLAVVLKDKYLYDGFVNIMVDFLYNENFYDGISTEGSAAYSGMVGGMWNLFRTSGLTENKEFMAKHPIIPLMGKTISRVSLVRGGNAPYGDDHPTQYWITKPTPKTVVPGEELGGFGISILRAGAPDKRMEIFLHHDRVEGHSHDDMLGLQLFYRGIPMLEHFGDTRDTKDLNSKLPEVEEFKKLKYPYPIVTNDPRPRGFNLQDMTTSLTKNLVMVNEYWSANGWYTAYRGGEPDLRAPYGNLIARTGRMPENVMQFVEADGMDSFSKNFQGMSIYKRAIVVVTRPDGTPYAVDFFSVSGGQRHLFLLHSRGKEISSTLSRGKKYKHLEDLPEVEPVPNLKMNAANVFFPGKVLNNVDLGGNVKDSWSHAWLFDYSAWAPKTTPLPAELKVEPHVFSIHGLLKGYAQAIRADGHYPVTIREVINGKKRSYRFQFENAVHYAGLRVQNATSLSNCYIQCYSSYSEKEKPLIASVAKLTCDDPGNIYKSAVEINFPDGSRDIVVWQPYSEMTSWDSELFTTDARAALIRVNKKGKVKFVSLSGGTKLIWMGRTFVKDGKGTLTARISRIIGDISGDHGKSILVLKNASDWPAGTVLKGQTIIAGYNKGSRREVYTIDRIEQKNGETFVYLENAPFFIDHRGEVTSNSREFGNRFWGTGTGKGGTKTRYLSGSQVVFPELKKSFTLNRAAFHKDYANTWILSEKTDLVREGIKTGTRFEIHPDWENAIVEVMTITNKEL
ncbi:MAG: hypothetical protein E7040_06565 [Lentisphaerae bacterium]|nr:hypothetical protein [Lentisphaerota bacterium]